MPQKKTSTPRRDVVTLADLAPQHDVKGGSQRRVFGADPVEPISQGRRNEMTPSKASAKRARDLPAKSAGNVKGGRSMGNDNTTLIRAARPTNKTKDLSPKSTSVKGGGVNLNDNVTLIRAAKPAPKRKDLSARKEVKAGGKRLNDNLTLVRAATRKTKDLPPKSTSVKGGGQNLNENITLVRSAR